MAGEEEPFLPPSETGNLEPGVRYELSPDGFVRIDFETLERRHGKTWEEVSVCHAQRNRYLFSLPYFFEADVQWTGPRTFALIAGKAYTGYAIRVDVDADAGKGRCVVAETGRSFRCADAERLIERAYDAHVRSIPPDPAAVSVSDLQPKPTPVWRDPDY